MMYRADFRAIADALARCREGNRYTVTYQAAIDDVTRALADVLAASNPRFDRGRFLAAAGASEGGDAPRQ